MTASALTVNLTHERLDDVVTDELEVGVSDPMGYVRLGAGEEVV